ncbi:hypothetical protein HED22_10530 [Thalassospira sp. HF15]|uniref:hypothetical protein n=1 Tax=Thalassospira sp. HF15 TaxID=2722755 RepID=UPI001431CA45|nr:hypothetical protein [Thalassospira sp. HF15]NIY76081.1 hypothetical protein [Thalassospira sp. HF15]
MTAQSDYQQALSDIAALAKTEAGRITGRPSPEATVQILRAYSGTIAKPMTDDLKSGTWKKLESWQLGGMLQYLGTYGTSDAVQPLREIEKNYPIEVIQEQAKELADLLATLDVAVAEARKLKAVTDAISSGNSDKMVRAMLLALAQLDPDWPVRASEIQEKLFSLSADSFPAINELASGKLSEDDVTKGLINILFEEFLTTAGTSGTTTAKP